MKCSDKKLYFDRVVAEMTKIRVEKKFRKKFKVYNCEKCGYWHLASKKKEK